MSHPLPCEASKIFHPTALCLLLSCVAALCLCASSSAQAPQLLQQSNGGSMNPGQTQPGPRGNPETQLEQENSAGMQVQPGSYALTGQQIFALLETKPEVIVELKQLTADQLQQQGLRIQADSISDEALYLQIGSSQPLRIAMTNYLHARGYITDQDIQRGEPIGLATTRLPGQNTRLAENDDSDDPAVALRNLQALSQIPGGTLRPGAGDEITDPEAIGLSPNLAQLAAGRSPNAASAGSNLQPSMRDAQPAEPPRDMDAHNTTDAPEVLRQPAPYNLRSLRDLYTQIPETSAPLKRFGSEVFTRRTAPPTQRSVSTNAMLPALPGLPALPQAPMENTPLDIPIGPDYVVGPGDSLTIDLWGGIAQTLTRVIDREGRISLPESGTVAVAGLTLGRAQTLIENTLKQQYRDAHVSVTVSRLRTVRVYVVGDVQRPGGYDINSLSTPLNALYAAGGPTSVGSLRVLRHYRGKELVADIDLYDFLLHGMRVGDDRFQGGDTLLVPAAGPQVAVSGAVKRPAIYELLHGSTLAEVLDDAGGATVAAALGHITVERIDANQHRETVTVAVPGDADAKGAQAALAAFAIKDGDRVHLSPILPFSERVVYLEGHVVRPGRAAYRDGMRLNDLLHSYQDLLPEPAAKGEIIRLAAPDYHAETIEFNVAEALIGNTNLELQPFDTIRVLGRYTRDAPRVMVRGEVLRPGTYPLSEGMTAAELVRMAGGFRRGALQQDADLTSYQVVNGSKVLGQHMAIQIGAAVTHGDRAADVSLKPGDILTIHQITGWNDIGASVTLAGEASHPGSYGFQEGEHLSSILRRAGGLRDTSYPEGAVLLRVQVRELEEKSRAELIRQIETSSAAARLAPNLSGADNAPTLQLIQQQQEQVLARLRSTPASGRLVIHISADINSWAGTDADIEVRRGDVLTIPKRPGFVLVSGQVYNTSAITFVPGKTAGWYLARAGGASDLANRKEIFIIRANGTVVGRHSGSGNVLNAQLDAGDVVVVPQKIIGASPFLRNLLTIGQIAASATFTAVVAGV